ncbi:MAG: YfjI family protein [Humidesulfovibrio sp.]|nr:YfjI family protein [Humidesulfovibrio sp.]
MPDVDPELLPPILGEFCEAVAEGLQVPFELVLINALACVAVAGQRKFKVQVRQDYTEPVNIYALAALPPGERKSATAEACKRPLIDWETEAQEEARENIRNTLSERKTLEKAIEAKRAKAGNAKTAEDRRALIDEIKALEAELPEVPAAPRLLIDDVTPEAIPAFMERQQERAGIIEAEGGLFDILAGRYSKGVPNLDAVLKFWSGEAVHVDRRSGQNIVLHDPALTICLSPQPEVVRGLADKPGFRGRGLLGRFLFLLPRSRVGSREVEPRPIPQAVQVRYAAKVRGLLALPWALGTDGKATSYHILLAPDAYREWLDFHRDVEAELRPGGELELIADWGGKLHGAAARLAGLLHLVEHEAPHRHPIGLGTMQQALGLAAVLTEHAKAAFALMGADPDIECAKHILAWIVDRRIDAFQAREAFQAVKGRYSKMEPVKAGLTILEDRAVIFPAQVQTREPGKAGRPASPGYTVNPLALGGAI